MSWIWGGILVLSWMMGVVSGNADGVLAAATQGAWDGVQLCLVLAGAYAFWMGMLKLAEAGGLCRGLARVLKGAMTFLFPQASKDEEASGAITMNMAANMLGLGNAATPYGLSAMKHLHRLSGGDEASDDMCMLLVINNASLQLLPTTVIALRAAAGSSSPGDILMPTLLSTAVSALVAVLLAKLRARRRVL